MAHTEPFAANTYAVLDVPSHVADQVMAIRTRHRDELRAALPVEITVIGSSGVGEFKTGQDPAHVFAILDSIAATTPPIRAGFGPVHLFPGTDIFVLTLTDERPFRALHERIAGSGILFQTSSFPFTPHCTLHSRSPILEEDVADLLSVEIADRFLIDTLSVYMLDALPCTLLHRVSLTG
jgi:2'-5' RNA ligase